MPTLLVDVQGIKEQIAEMPLDQVISAWQELGQETLDPTELPIVQEFRDRRARGQGFTLAGLAVVLIGACTALSALFVPKSQPVGAAPRKQR